MMNAKEKNFVSAVIYVHNASGRIERFLGLVIDTLEKNFEHSEIICVNDGCSDNSVEIIKSMSQNAASVGISLVNMSYFHGLEVAMNAGVDLSIGDFVFEFDNTTPDFGAEEIMRVYRRSLEGYDIVSAAPDKRERFTSGIFYRVFDRFTDIPYKMQTESFRILSRRVINRVGSMNRTIPYRKAAYATQGLKTDVIKYEPAKVEGTDRDRQEKGYRSELAIDSLILFTDVGYRFARAMTAVMMIMSAFMVIYSVVVFAMAHPVEGWTTTILFLSATFFGLFGILTVIIKYLQILVDLVFKRKQYSFESIEKLTK
jgi:dolichol-phosphate mannosyltransferase